MADSKKKRPRRSFSDEFKREAVALYRSSDVSAEQVVTELGLHFTNVERMRKLGDTLYDSNHCFTPSRIPTPCQAIEAV